jgi:hypothetical protein
MCTQVRACVFVRIVAAAHQTPTSHGAQVVFTDPVNACVLWRIELDYVRGCNHVNLVTETHVEVRGCFMRRGALVCAGLAHTSKVH